LHIFNRDKFFEDLNNRIDKPIDYNHLLASIIGDILDQLEQSDVFFVDGIGYHKDLVRNKFLSLDRKYTTATAYGLRVTNRYLKVGEVTTQGQQGVRMARSGTITSVTAKSRSTGSYFVEIRKNGAPITYVSMEVTGGGTHINNVDIDFNEGDFIQFYVDGSNVEHPIVELETAWRVVI